MEQNNLPENEKNEQIAVVPMQTNAVPVDIDQTVANLQKWAKHQATIRKLAVMQTNQNDWTDEGGKPYLVADGAYKIANACGMSISNVNKEPPELTRDEFGEVVTYEYNCTATFMGRTTPQMGSCNTRDKMFGMKSVGGKSIPLPLAEVNTLNVKKKSYTNMMNRAIKSCLGLSFTWEEIEDLSEGKIKRDGCAKVSYGKGKKGGSTASQSTNTKTKGEEVWKWLLELYNGQTELAADALQHYTSFVNKEKETIPGKRDISKISDNQMQFLYGKVKRVYDKNIDEVKKKMEGNDGKKN